MRVLIVDDHPRFRQIARRVLELDGWTVVGEAADGAGVFDALEAAGTDVVLLDVGLPDVSGLELARTLIARDPQVAVVITSSHESADYRELALASGARGFVPKSALTGAALDAIVGASGPA